LAAWSLGFIVRGSVHGTGFCLLVCCRVKGLWRSGNHYFAVCRVQQYGYFVGAVMFYMTGGGICEVAVFMGHVLEKRENCRLIVQAGDW